MPTMMPITSKEDLLISMRNANQLMQPGRTPTTTWKQNYPLQASLRILLKIREICSWDMNCDFDLLPFEVDYIFYYHIHKNLINYNFFYF
jgi:hypothetical protein